MLQGFAAIVVNGFFVSDHEQSLPNSRYRKYRIAEVIHAEVVMWPLMHLFFVAWNDLGHSFACSIACLFHLLHKPDDRSQE